MYASRNKPDLKMKFIFLFDKFDIPKFSYILMYTSPICFKPFQSKYTLPCTFVQWIQGIKRQTKKDTS